MLNSELFFFSVKHFYGGGVLGEHGIRMKHTFFEKFPCLTFNEKIECDAKELQQTYSNTLNENLNDYIMTLYQLTEKEKLYIKENKLVILGNGYLLQEPEISSENKEDCKNKNEYSDNQWLSTLYILFGYPILFFQKVH